MKIPEGLDQRIKEVLARHLPPENSVTEGETAHLEVIPLDAHIVPDENKAPPIKRWVSFIELSQPPEDD